VLPLGGQGAVFGDDAPAILLGAVLDFLGAGIDHGLDGEGHAGHEFFQGAGAAVMQHLGLFVEAFANTVAAKFTHDAKALAFGEFLNGKANVTQMHAGFDHHDALPHGFVGEGAQTLGGDGHLAHMEHAAGVTVPAIFDDGHIDIDNVALFERLVIGDAMADLVVDRGADGLGVGRIAATGVVQGRGDGVLHLGDVVVRQFVDFVGGHTGFDEGRQVVQNFGGEFAGNAHSCNALGVFVSDSHGRNYPIGRLCAWREGILAAMLAMAGKIAVLPPSTF